MFFPMSCTSPLTVASTTLPLPRRSSPLFLLGFHERLEVRNGALHHPGGLHHLRQEHLARAEQVADDLHPVHQRALDDVERTLGLLAGLLGVRLDVVGDAVHERVLKALADGRVPPGEVDLRLPPRRRTSPARRT